MIEGKNTSRDDKCTKLRRISAPCWTFVTVSNEELMTFCIMTSRSLIPALNLLYTSCQLAACYKEAISLEVQFATNLALALRFSFNLRVSVKRYSLPLHLVLCPLRFSEFANSSQKLPRFQSSLLQSLVPWNQGILVRESSFRRIFLQNVSVHHKPTRRNLRENTFTTKHGSIHTKISTIVVGTM